MGSEVNSYPSVNPPNEAPPPIAGAPIPQNFAFPILDWQTVVLLLIMQLGFQLSGITLGTKTFVPIPIGTLHKHVQALLKKLETEIFSKVLVMPGAKDGANAQKEGSSSGFGILQNVKNVLQDLAVFKFITENGDISSLENSSLENPSPEGDVPVKANEDKGQASSVTAKAAPRNVPELLQFTRMAVDFLNGQNSPHMAGEKIIKDLDLLKTSLLQFISQTEKKFSKQDQSQIKPFLEGLKEMVEKLETKTVELKQFLQEKGFVKSDPASPQGATSQQAAKSDLTQPPQTFTSPGSAKSDLTQPQTFTSPEAAKSELTQPPQTFTSPGSAKSDLTQPQTFTSLQSDVEKTLHTLLKEFTSPLQRQVPQRFQVLDHTRAENQERHAVSDAARNFLSLPTSRPFSGGIPEKSSFFSAAERNLGIPEKSVLSFSANEKNSLSAHILKGLLSETRNPSGLPPLVHQDGTPPLSFVVPYFNPAKNESRRFSKSTKGKDRKDEEQEYREGQEKEQDLSYL